MAPQKAQGISRGIRCIKWPLSQNGLSQVLSGTDSTCNDGLLDLLLAARPGDTTHPELVDDVSVPEAGRTRTDCLCTDPDVLSGTDFACTDDDDEVRLDLLPVTRAGDTTHAELDDDVSVPEAVRSRTDCTRTDPGCSGTDCSCTELDADVWLDFRLVTRTGDTTLPVLDDISVPEAGRTRTEFSCTDPDGYSRTEVPSTDDD